MSTIQPQQVDRPSIYAAAVSPTAVSNVAASSLLIICLFLPHSTAAGKITARPISILASIADGSADSIAALSVLWPFGLAFYTAAAFVGLILIRPIHASQLLVLGPVFFSVALAALWMLYLFSGTEASRDAMVLVALIVPLGSCVAARMVWLVRLGQLTAAAAWGQSSLCILAAYSLRWFWIEPVQTMQWGGMLAIASAIMMMFASWPWYTRGCRDLSDRSISIVPFQVSLKRVLAAVAASAVALTYWQAIERWGN